MKSNTLNVNLLLAPTHAEQSELAKAKKAFLQVPLTWEAAPCSRGHTGAG